MNKDQPYEIGYDTQAKEARTSNPGFPETYQEKFRAWAKGRPLIQTNHAITLEQAANHLDEMTAAILAKNAEIERLTALHEDHWVARRELTANRDQWQQRCDRLRAALEQYGAHTPDCRSRIAYANAEHRACDCGFSKALAGAADETKEIRCKCGKYEMQGGSPKTWWCGSQGIKHSYDGCGPYEPQ